MTYTLAYPVITFIAVAVVWGFVGREIVGIVRDILDDFPNHPY